MNTAQKFILFLLRISIGWLIFYAGITKVLNPGWSAEGFLRGAKTFSGFYQWLTTPEILQIVNFLNAWGVMLIGVSLILGIFVRFSATLGVVVMALYYFPILVFPYAGEHSYLVDEHVIYALVLTLLASSAASKAWSIRGIPGWMR